MLSGARTRTDLGSQPSRQGSNTPNSHTEPTCLPTAPPTTASPAQSPPPPARPKKTGRELGTSPLERFFQRAPWDGTGSGNGTEGKGLGPVNGSGCRTRERVKVTPVQPSQSTALHARPFPVEQTSEGAAALRCPCPALLLQVPRKWRCVAMHWSALPAYNPEKVTSSCPA